MPKIMHKGIAYGGGGGGNANLVELTKAEYDALEAAGDVKADTLYLITDGIPGTDAGMGNTDISGIGDGTVTGAVSEPNSKTTNMIKTRKFTGITDAIYGTIALPSDIPVDRVLNVHMSDGSIYYNASLRGVGNILVWNYDEQSQKVVPITGAQVCVLVTYY